MNKKPYIASKLPIEKEYIDQTLFLDELIDASAMLEVYKQKIKDSKLNSIWLLPTLQQREALASVQLEGTQATLDGVLINQIVRDEKDLSSNEVENYIKATNIGYRVLARESFSLELFKELHTILMSGKVRKTSELVGQFREEQNYIGKLDKRHTITYIPPEAKDVVPLMKNLIEYIENDTSYRPLVQVAIIHAQLETIHPFMDGNGRVGRMLIPLYLYYKKQIDLPCFFISEALEQDKVKYYTLLNNIREKNEWSEWIKFFLKTVKCQCEKYIDIVSKINILYDEDLAKAGKLVNSSQIVDIINLLYRYPIINSSVIIKETNIPLANVNRYLKKLVDGGILFSDEKRKNRTYYYYNLLDIIRI